MTLLTKLGDTMNKLTNKQSKIMADVRKAIRIDIEVLEDYLAEGRKEMVRHNQDSIREKIYGIRSYLIYSDETKGHKNWSAIQDEFRSILEMPVLSVEVWLDLIGSDRAVSEKEWKKANA